MLKTVRYFFTRIYTIISIVLFIFTYTALKVGAIYYPTDNITNPSCAPGDSGCYVSLLPDQTSNSGSLLFTNGTNPSWTSSSALSWDSVNGRLGVGTSTPGYKLDITDSSLVNLVRIKAPSDTYGGALSIESSASGQESSIRFYDQVKEWTIGTYSDKFFAYSQTYGGIPFQINSNGNVGIGTTNPGHKLTIGDGTGNNFLSIANSSTNIYIGQSGNTRFGYAGGTIGLLLQSATNIAMGIGTYGGDAPLIFGTNNIERMRISGTSGNIGIGTTSPVSKFHIATSPTASVNYGTFSLGSGAFDGTTSGYFGTASSSNTNGTSLAINEASGYAGDLMNLQVAGLSKFKVSSVGNVTIGSNSGNALLSVIGDNTAGLIQAYRYQTTQTSPRFELYKARGTQASPTALVATDIAGSFDVNGYNGTGFDRLTTIRTWVDSIVGNVITPSMSFEIGTSAAASESKMTLWNTGNFLIASNAHGLTDNGNKLQVIGTGYFSGNVGIGTITPSANLHIEPSGGSGEVWQWIKNSRDTASVASLYVENNSGMNIALKSYGSTYASTIFGVAAANTMSIMAGGANNGLFIGHSGNSKPIIFGQGSTENMRIAATTGNLGIGTSNPTEKLHVYQNIDNALMFKVENPSAGTGVSSRMVLVTDTIGQIILNGANNTSLGGANSMNIVNNASAPITFLTSLTERMRISSTGNVGVGTSVPISRLSNSTTNIVDFASSRNVDDLGIVWKIASTGAKYVAGFENTTNSTGAGGVVIRTVNTNGGTYLLQLVANSTEVASFTGDGNAFKPGGGSFTATSDQRAKKDISSLGLGLDAINSLNPVTFKYNGLYPTAPDNGKTYVGLIAQDVIGTQLEQYLVSIDENNGLYRLDPSAIPFALVGAIKELDIKVNQLSSLDTTLTGSFGYLAKEFIGNASNSITDLYAKVIHSDRVETKELCTTDGICLSENDIKNLYQISQERNQPNQQVAPENPPTEELPPEEVIPQEDVEEIVE